MSDYILSCCSTADLTKEHFEARDIHYICFHYSLDGKNYYDDLGQSVPFPDFYNAMQIYNDALTGLNNRRRLNIYLEETLPKATVQRPMLLFIMDIDNFKSINDAYGHLEGDSALKAFSDAMKDVAIRYSAFIARYGGDEFCMVMDACGKSPETVAEDIRQSLRNTHIKCQAADDSYKLMASIGFAVCDGTEQNPELELARADRMLYEEKAQKAHQRTAAV